MLMQVRSFVCLAVACFLVGGGHPLAVQAAQDDASSTQAEQATDADANAEEPGETEEEPHHKEDEGGGGTMSFKTDLALWSLITFLVFVFVLKAFAWGPLVEGLDKRELNFRTQLAEAEAARMQAEKMLQEHAAKLESVQDEVKAIIDEAKQDAEHTKNDIIEQAQKEAKLTQERAIHEIERSRDAALKELFDTMSSQVASATEHVIGRSLNDDDRNRLIDEALSQFSAQ
jgi:F-type H+-transporting ATPase subunit b